MALPLLTDAVTCGNIRATVGLDADNHNNTTATYALTDMTCAGCTALAFADSSALQDSSSVRTIHLCTVRWHAGSVPGYTVHRFETTALPLCLVYA